MGWMKINFSHLFFSSLWLNITMYFSYKFCDKNFLRESFFQIIGIKHIKHNINRGLITSMCSAIFWIFVCVEHMVVWYVTKFAFILTVPDKEDGEPNQKWIKERCFQFFLQKLSEQNCYVLLCWLLVYFSSSIYSKQNNLNTYCNNL